MRPNVSAYREQKWAKYEVRRAYTGTWIIDMLDAPCQHPGCCLVSVLCPHATSFVLRRQALQQDMRRYSCCQGYSFCSPGCFGEQNCPDVCLGVEVLLCFPNSVLGTRFYLQDQMVLQNTQCDDNLIACEMALVQLSCICDCAALLSNNQDVRELAGLVHCLADHVYCSMCACMQTQHKLQMDARDRGELTVPVFPTTAPQVQMMEMPGGLVAQQQPYPQYAQQAPQYVPQAPQYAPQVPQYGQAPPPPGYGQALPPGAYPLQPPGSYYVQQPQPGMMPGMIQMPLQPSGAVMGYPQPGGAPPPPPMMYVQPQPPLPPGAVPYGEQPHYPPKA